MTPVEELRLQHDRELDALIDALVLAARQPLASSIDALLAALIALWVQLYGDLDTPADPAEVDSYKGEMLVLVAALPLVVDRPRLLKGLRQAVKLGVDQAVREGDGALKARRVKLPKRIVAEVDQIPARLQAIVSEAGDLITTLEMLDFGDVLAVAGKTAQALSTLDASVSTSATSAVAAGSDAAIVAAGVDRVWISESRGGCLTCLAYAGRVAKPGVPFPGGLSFGKVYFPDPVYAPPRHPNCRCRCAPWLGTSHRIGPPAVGGDYPSALRREAERSVLRGTATGESLRARIRAADKLIATNPALPKTVVARARRAVRTGTFT